MNFFRLLPIPTPGSALYGLENFVQKFAFSIPDLIGMSVSSHISFVAVGLAPADFKLVLAPRPSVAQLRFPVLPRGVTIPAIVAASLDQSHFSVAAPEFS
jgi:hypothetical protein